MKTIPSAREVRRALGRLSRQQLIDLAERCQVPVHTLLKIKSGETANPRLATVAAVWPHVRP